MNAHVSAPIATIRLYGDHLLPLEVDAIVGGNPTSAAEKGGVLKQIPGRPPVIAKTGTWFLTSKGRELGGPEGHLGWLINRIHPFYKRLQRRIPGIKIDISVIVHDPTFHPSDLSRRILQDATAMGDVEIEAPEAQQEWMVTKGNLSKFVKH